MINLRSDNESPVAQPILDSLIKVNKGSEGAYGADSTTISLETQISALFETDVSVFPVATGTAANALSLSLMCPPFGAVYCHPGAHINTDECGAPEFFTGGGKLICVDGDHGLVDPLELDRVLAKTGAHGIHECLPSALSVTQASEAGTVYGLEQLQALTEIAHRYGMKVHMDGARFANAMYSLGCSPAEATWKQGIDVLVLGATKNGAMAAEAVVIFNKELAGEFERRRKRAGHLFSKMRYLSAQLAAYLSNGLWLELAEQANLTASRLANGLVAEKGVSLVHPVHANEVFVDMPEAALVALETNDIAFYRWPTGPKHARMVCAFTTTEDEIDQVLAIIRQALS